LELVDVEWSVRQLERREERAVGSEVPVAGEVGERRPVECGERGLGGRFLPVEQGCARPKCSELADLARCVTKTRPRNERRPAPPWLGTSCELAPDRQ